MPSRAGSAAPLSLPVGGTACGTVPRRQRGSRSSWPSWTPIAQGGTVQHGALAVPREKVPAAFWVSLGTCLGQAWLGGVSPWGSLRSWKVRPPPSRLPALVREGQEAGGFWPEKGWRLTLSGQTLGPAAGRASPAWSRATQDHHCVPEVQPAGHSGGTQGSTEVPWGLPSLPSPPHCRMASFSSQALAGAASAKVKASAGGRESAGEGLACRRPCGVPLVPEAAGLEDEGPRVTSGAFGSPRWRPTANALV